MKGGKQLTGGSLQRHIAAGREIQIILLFVYACNNCSKSLFFGAGGKGALLFGCLAYADLCLMAAVRTAQNELSLGEELAGSSCPVGRKPLSSNLGIFHFPVDLGAAKYQIGIWATRRN